MAPISLERTAAAGNVDGPGTWDQGSTAREGRTREGVVLQGDASQLDPGLGSHRSVRSVRTICLPRAMAVPVVDVMF